MGTRSRRGLVPTGIPTLILGKIPVLPPSRLWKLILVLVPAPCSFYKNFPHVLNWEGEFKRKVCMYARNLLISVSSLLGIIYSDLSLHCPQLWIKCKTYYYTSKIMVLVPSLPILGNFPSCTRPCLPILENFPSCTRPCFLIIENFPYHSRIIVKILINAHVWLRYSHMLPPYHCHQG